MDPTFKVLPSARPRTTVATKEAHLPVSFRVNSLALCVASPLKLLSNCIERRNKR